MAEHPTARLAKAGGGEELCPLLSPNTFVSLLACPTILPFPQPAPPALPEPQIPCPTQNIRLGRSVQQLGMSLRRDLCPTNWDLK